MTRSGAGVVAARDLAPNWHLRLNQEQLAAYIRYHFVRLYDNVNDWEHPAHNRRRAYWDGGTDSYGVKRSSVWTRIANMVRQHNADPGAWVIAHFSPIALLRSGIQTSGLPEMRPTMLSSGHSLEIYRTYCTELPGILATAFDVAGMTLAKRIRGTQNLNLPSDDQVFYCVCDELYVSASPFFRNAFSSQLNCYRGVERYLWVAALDYEAQQRAYDAAVEPWCITDLLITAVHEIREHWENYR